MASPPREELFELLAPYLGGALIAIALLLMFFDTRLVGYRVPRWYMLLVFLILVSGVGLIGSSLPPEQEGPCYACSSTM